MLAYAANRPLTAVRKSSPNAMLAIIAAHVAVVAVMMSVKMEIPRRIHEPPIIVDWIKTQPPPPNPVHTVAKPQPGPSNPNHFTPIPPLPLPDPGLGGPTTVDPAPTGPANPIAVPDPLPPTHLPGITIGARLATSSAELKPPYPGIKLASEEEAVLKLRLTIDPNGRVVAVEPVGRADPVFLDAARRHLLAHWRYKPAMEDGRAATSTTVITLRFQLDG
jgi:protein TonB